MKPLLIIYHDGKKVRLCVFEKREKKYLPVKLATLSSEEETKEPTQKPEFMSKANSNVDYNGELTFDESTDFEIEVPEENTFDIQQLSDFISPYNLKKFLVVPVISQPDAEYIFTKGNFGDDKKNEQQLIAEIEERRTSEIVRDRFSYQKGADSLVSGMYVPSRIPALDIFNQAISSSQNKKYKIYSVKSAEFSLGRFLKANHDFENNEYSLIIHSNSSVTNLIFLKQYDTIHTELLRTDENLEVTNGSISFSKILLGMDKAGISNIGNIFICGEGKFDELFIMLYEVFPDSNIGLLNLDSIDTSKVDGLHDQNILEYSVPFAVAAEVIEEIETGKVGTKLVPGGIYSTKRSLQIGWPVFILIPLLFLVAYHFTQKLLTNEIELKKIQSNVMQLEAERELYKDDLNDISNLSQRVNNFDGTISTLRKVTSQSSNITRTVDEIVKYISSNRSLWLTDFKYEKTGKLNISGYSLDRKHITKFADLMNSTTIEKIIYEPLREFKAFGFNLVINTEVSNER
ncbi:MAG: hypothetical protein K9G44_04535 [Melioribacteraceae bacterium]|nr:hypothetical protein [Melioribacteraceae bacterium]